MRIHFDDVTIPYPTSILRGYLRLSGLSRIEAQRVIELILSDEEVVYSSEIEILEVCKKKLSREYPQFIKQFNVMMEYHHQLRNGKLSHLILVIEGASATGKSMLAINMIYTLAATRIVSTDSIRQILRSQTNDTDSPELFCHTYQAHKFKQAGNIGLPSSVRGYLAQMETIAPAIVNTTQRLLNEGVSTIIEGVHISPGSLKEIGPCIIELFIHPDDDTHLGMFLSKAYSSGLKTVSTDKEKRKLEYKAARDIQHYLMDEATKHDIPIINLESYEDAEEEINRVIFRHIDNLVKKEV